MHFAEQQKGETPWARCTPQRQKQVRNWPNFVSSCCSAKSHCLLCPWWCNCWVKAELLEAIRRDHAQTDSAPKHRPLIIEPPTRGRLLPLMINIPRQAEGTPASTTWTEWLWTMWI